MFLPVTFTSTFVTTACTLMVIIRHFSRSFCILSLWKMNGAAVTFKLSQIAMDRSSFNRITKQLHCVSIFRMSVKHSLLWCLCGVCSLLQCPLQTRSLTCLSRRRRLPRRLTSPMTSMRWYSTRPPPPTIRSLLRSTLELTVPSPPTTVILGATRMPLTVCITALWH